MHTDKKYAKELKSYVAKRWTAKKRNIFQVLQENLDDEKHNMLIEEDLIDFILSQKELEKENHLLEKVDLTDYWKIFENGRTNQTR